MAQHQLAEDMMAKYPNPQVGGISEVIARHFLKQLSCALEFLRSNDLIHRDIKPQNLLLHPSPDICAKGLLEAPSYKGRENSFSPVVGVSSFPMLKVADFGFARSLPSTSLADTLCGSPLYMAPEILRYEKYDAKADLWSVGAVLYEMVAGRPPFGASNHVELLRVIERGDDRVRFPRGAEISDEMKALIRHLLKRNPVERVNFKDYFENPILVGDIPGLVDEDLQEQLERNATFDVEKDKDLLSHGDRKAIHSQPQSPSFTNFPSASPSDRSHRPTTPRPSSRNAPPQSGMQRAGSRDQIDMHRAAVEGRRASAISHPPSPVLQENHLAGEGMDRQRSNNPSSPKPSSRKDKTSDQRHPARQSKDGGVSDRERERAAQDIAFERDYVVVEKRAVEVNAFADELAASPRLQQQYQPPPRQGGQIVRRATTTAASPRISNNQQGTSNRTQQTASGRPRADSTHYRRSSYDRRYGPNPVSATSAISKALNKASGRLFGVSFSPPLATTKSGRSPPLGYNPFPTYPLAQSSMVVVGDEAKAQPILDEDSKAVRVIEECATRSDVVYGFAEVKYKQLVPTTPSSRPDGPVKDGENSPQVGAQLDGPNDGDLTVDAVLTLSEEALVLYLKSLSLLAKSMDIAGAWWVRKNRSEVPGDSPPSKENHTSVTAANRVNNVVQWVRNRFNEVLQKAEYSRRRLADAQKQLPPDHPYHANNILTASGSAAAAAFDQAPDQMLITSGTTAEKLMYDRALEMSRTAAINELTGEDLSGCEIAYVTAIRMLEAVLESDDVPPISKARNNETGDGGSRASEQEIHDEDREVVAKRKF